MHANAGAQVPLLRFSFRRSGGVATAIEHRKVPLLSLSFRRSEGGVLLIIDAKSDRAAAWYRGYGATALQDKPSTLVLTLATFVEDLRTRSLL